MTSGDLLPADLERDIARRLDAISGPRPRGLRKWSLDQVLYFLLYLLVYLGSADFVAQSPLRPRSASDHLCPGGDRDLAVWLVVQPCPPIRDLHGRALAPRPAAARPGLGRGLAAASPACPDDDVSRRAGDHAPCDRRAPRADPGRGPARHDLDRHRRTRGRGRDRRLRRATMRPTSTPRSCSSARTSRASGWRSAL